MTTETVKGFRDIEDAEKRNRIRDILESIFKKYCFYPVETPIIEYEEFVKGDNQDDEAVSSIFKLEDRGKRKLALRYEFTFQLKRLVQNKKLPFRRYQIGQVFRDEPTSGNRWRQFTQCDIDVVGSSVKDEAEILAANSEILNKIGLKFTININNRKLLNEILNKEGIKEKVEVIREIDKLDKLSESEIKKNLKKYKAEKLLAIFKQPTEFFEKYESYKEIKALQEVCSFLGIKINFVPFLARGLSYYNGSIFEIKSDIKETIAGGGSYLVNDIQATGISFGLDRLETLAKFDKAENGKVLIISIKQDREALILAKNLREKNIACIVMCDKTSKSLEYANYYKIPFVIFIGENEVKEGKVKLRDMSSGQEKMLSSEEVANQLK